MHGLRIFCRLCMMLAALALPLGGMSAPAAWAQSAGTGSSDTIDNSAEYAMNPTMPSRAPSTAATLLTGAAIVGGAFVVGVAALGTATGGLLAAGAAAMLYATMP